MIKKKMQGGSQNTNIRNKLIVCYCSDIKTWKHRIISASSTSQVHCITNCPSTSLVLQTAPLLPLFYTHNNECISQIILSVFLFCMVAKYSMDEYHVVIHIVYEAFVYQRGAHARVELQNRIFIPVNLITIIWFAETSSVLSQFQTL